MYLDLLLTSFVSLFVIIDPIGTTPVYISLTAGMTNAERRAVSLRAILVAGFLMLFFGVAGEKLLEFVGIGMPAFRISAGLLLFLTALDMLFERRTERRERRAAEPRPDPSVFPLAMPLLAGPGSLATMILLTSQNSGDLLALSVINAVMVANLVIAYLLFGTGGFVERVLGQTGVTVITRLLGMLLAALAVQFVLNGLRELGLIAA